MGFRYYIKNDKVILKVKNQTKKRFKKELKNINALLDKHFITNKYYLEVKNRPIYIVKETEKNQEREEK